MPNQGSSGDCGTPRSSRQRGTSEQGTAALTWGLVEQLRDSGLVEKLHEDGLVEKLRGSGLVETLHEEGLVEKLHEKGCGVTTTHDSDRGFLGNINQKNSPQPPVENEPAQGSTCGMGKKTSELPSAHVLLSKGIGIMHEEKLNVEPPPSPVPTVTKAVSSTLHGFKRRARSNTNVMSTQRPGGSSKRKTVDVRGDGQQPRIEGVQKKGRKHEAISVNATNELAVAVDQSHQQL